MAGEPAPDLSPGPRLGSWCHLLPSQGVAPGSAWALGLVSR